MASLVPERSLSPVYRRPKDDTSKHNCHYCWSSNYGNTDMPSLCNQDTVTRNQSWVIDALHPLDPSVSMISFTDLDKSSSPLYPDAHHYQSTPSEIQPLQSDTDPATDPDVFEEQKEDESVNVLELVPKENVVEDIKTVFRYLKQLGSGMRCIFSLLLMPYCEWIISFICLAGASCNVFKVCKIQKEKGGNQYVALKRMPRDDKSNAIAFAREYHVLRKLVHPNIVVCFCVI